MRITDVENKAPLDACSNEPSRYDFPSYEVKLTIEGWPLPRFKEMIDVDIHILPLDVIEAMSEEAREEMRRATDKWNKARKAFG